MKTLWLNDGNPDERGNFAAQVQDDNGNPVSTFKGPTIKAVADQILTSNATATAEIGRLKQNRQPDRAPTEYAIGAPKPLSADDRFRLSIDIQDPSKAPEAIAELITAATGASPEAIHQTLSEVQIREKTRRLKEVSEQFVASNPGYHPVTENKDRIVQALQLKGMDYTVNNLQIVYDELQAQGLLIEPPAQDVAEHEEQQPERQAANPASEPNPPRQTRPRLGTVSTGIRNSDTSGQRPPAQPSSQYSRTQIEQMPADVYRENMRDKRFRDQVDRMGR